MFISGGGLELSLCFAGTNGLASGDKDAKDDGTFTEHSSGGDFGFDDNSANVAAGERGDDAADERGDDAVPINDVCGCSEVALSLDDMSSISLNSLPCPRRTNTPVGKIPEGIRCNLADLDATGDTSRLPAPRTSVALR